MVFRARACIFCVHIYCLQSETHLIVIGRGETINSHVIAGHNIHNFFSFLGPSMPRMYIMYYNTHNNKIYATLFLQKNKQVIRVHYKAERRRDIVTIFCLLWLTGFLT